jgi:tRNA threonylcarbamoyladenosine biosynthesis protein TsaB
MTILHIDTRDNKNVVAKLDIDGKIIEANSINEDRRPESIVNLIAAVCEKAGIRVQDVDEINVEEGPGSYTGLKVGVSVANALSFALGKKVNGKMIGEIVEPTYE